MLHDYFRISLVSGLAVAVASLATAQDHPTHAPELLVDSLLPLAHDYGLESETRLSRPVEIRIDLLADTADAGQGLLRISLFGDEAIDVRFESSGSTLQGGMLWVGKVVGDPHGDVLIAVHGDKVAASIRYDHNLLRIGAGSNGVHGLTLVDENHFLPCGTNHNHEVRMPADVGLAEEGALLYADVLVAYSPQARSTNGGTNGINSLINLAVLETNQSYDNAEVAHDLRLVHTLETVQAETNDMGEVLSRVRSTNDGWYDEVHAARDTYGADFVAMITAGGQYCGIAYLMTNVSQGFASSAFSVTLDSCATGNYSFGHELGHNMGCAHDRDNASSGAYAYSFGYRTPNNQYRTVMAYSPGSRIKYFSNPDVTFNGFAMGIAHPDPDSADNARGLDTASPTFTDFRDEVTGPQVLFSDDFESGNFGAGGWTISDAGRCKVNGNSAYTGSGGARLKKGGVGTPACTVGTEETWIEAPSFSTVGFTSVDISLAAHFRQNELACEYLDLQWWDGLAWVSYATVEQHSWAEYTFALPAGATENPDVRLRFQTNAKGQQERAEIDNLVVIGTP
ncbi:MAG: M12 family metallo-peptidase [Planctomycetota bacterium]|nr:M12 family metallo-peptidase [Planctomycetota bacterium]